MRFLSTLKSWFKKEEGVAIVVTLLVMLILVLLGLSLLLQSSTEHLIAVNEQDSIKALSYAEAGLDILNRVVKNYSNLTPRPPNLSNLLDGPSSAPSDYNLPDFINFSGTPPFRANLDTSRGPDAFRASNEKTTAFVATIDSKIYEVFRLGEDTNADGLWDGPRAEVYVRFEDNYDDAPPLNVTDTDYRMRAYVIADYPIFVNSDGSPNTQILEQRGVARRRLLGKFEPTANVAIRTDGDLEISQILQVCGECGGVHSNGTLTLNGGLTTCAEATGTAGLSNDAAGYERGGVGITGPVHIPVVNPYDDLYVPTTGDFDHSLDTEFDTQSPAQPGTPRPELKCPGPSATDPGSSKYFAFVGKTINNSKQFQVYKAYWDDTTPAHWRWRLIDQQLNGSENLDAKLDNCGRVISGHMVPGPDPGANPAKYVDDGGDAEFYGFQMSQNYRTDACTTDKSLTGTTKNDFTTNAFPMMPIGSAVTEPLPIGNNTDVNVPPLPGSTRTRTVGSETDPTTDGQADWTWTPAIRASSGIIQSSSNAMFSPMYNAVVFVYANAQMSGNLGNLFYYSDPAFGGSGAHNASGSLPWGRMRISIISFGDIEVTGGPHYGPANKNGYQFTAVAGRDLDLGGNAGSQQVCPPNMSADGTNCTSSTGIVTAYAGVFLAHEQIRFHGNVTLDGYIIAEDAADCINGTQSSDDQAFGSVQIHYDCGGPPDMFSPPGTSLVSWEEIQQ